MTTLTASDVVLKIISDTVLSVSTTCIEAAANNLSLIAQAGGTITIENCTINSTTSSTEFPPSCTTSNVSIMTQNSTLLKSQLQKMLQDAIQAKDNMSGTKNSFISTITESITAGAVATCMAVAVNSIAFNLKSAKNITINSCNFNQTASANIAQCIHAVTVTQPDGTQIPLTPYVQSEIDNSGNYYGAIDENGNLVPSVPVLNDPKPPEIAAYTLIGFIIITLLSFFLLLRKQH